MYVVFKQNKMYTIYKLSANTKMHFKIIYLSYSQKFGELKTYVYF